MMEDFPELAEARKVWSSGRIVEALRAFEQAVASRPGNVRARVEFSRVLVFLHEIRRADMCLRQAETLADGDPGATLAVARAFRSAFRQDDALRLFTALHATGQLEPQAVGEFAVLLQQFGRLDEALDAAAECVAAAAGRPEPQVIQAKILHQSGRLDEAESLLTGLLKSPYSTEALELAVHGELAQVYDRRGRFSEAVASATRANELVKRSPQATKLMAQANYLNQQFAGLYDQLDAESVARWQSEASATEAEDYRVAHLLSFPRTGTTLLEQVLDAHPDVVGAPERVIFSKLIYPVISQGDGQLVVSVQALENASSEIVAGQAARYVRLHSEVAGVELGNRTLVDKNPNHTSLWAALYRLLPRSKFIVMHRDPRDVVVSCYLRNFPVSEYSVAFLDWQSTCELYCAEQKILSRLLELLPEQCVEVAYEDLVRDVQGESNRVLRFLGREAHSDTQSYLERTRQKIVNSPSQFDVKRPVESSRVGRWENYAEFLEPYVGQLSEASVRKYG